MILGNFMKFAQRWRNDEIIESLHFVLEWNLNCGFYEYEWIFQLISFWAPYLLAFQAHTLINGLYRTELEQ